MLPVVTLVFAWGHCLINAVYDIFGFEPCEIVIQNLKKETKREGTYVYLWLIHVDVWQKPAQYCKAIICQLKKREREMANKYMGQTTKDLYNTKGVCIL